MTERLLPLLADNWRARRQGTTGLASRQRRRLIEIVALARARSPYYASLYRELPQQVADPTLLPITTKPELVRHFDDWATDREVTLERARAFVDDPDRIGERFLDRYTVTTTSGTTGTRGIFVLDDRTLRVSTALTARMAAAWLSPGDVARIVARRGRMAMVIGTGGHYASAVAAARLRQSSRRRARGIRVFPIDSPRPEIVAALNQFKPAVLAPYASMGLLLGEDQEAGRLHIDPALVVLSAEGLAPGEYDRIAAAFGAKVRHGYAATECPFLSYSCSDGWLHVNIDWLVLEPVDADHRPTPPGEQSHTVLVTNLANRVQPILHYDLGDSILQRPDPCPCGDPLPAIRVEGRTAEVLTFRTDDEGLVSIPPLSFATLADRTPGLERLQVVQTAPATLRLRVRPAPGADEGSVWQAVQAETTRLLHGHGIGHVAIEPGEEPPEQAVGGKYRTVIPLG